MKKVIENLFGAYLNNVFNDVVPEYSAGEKRKEFDKLWKKLNANFTVDEQNSNHMIMCDADYESGLSEFYNAFRLGFILCAEVFLSE